MSENNTKNPLDDEIAKAGAQLSSLQSKDTSANANLGNGAINRSLERSRNADNNSAISGITPRRESIGVVNVMGDALFGRRPSFGVGGDMVGDITGVGAGSMMARRGSMDSVVDAAIQNLANRRLSMLGGSTHAAMTANAMNNTIGVPGGMGIPHLGVGPSIMGGGLGMMGMQGQGMNGLNGRLGMNMGMSSQMNQFLMNGLGLNSVTGTSNHPVANPDATSAESGAATTSTTANRQKQLQEQRLELQRRQKELEFQRQQLLTAMEERKKAMQQMQQTIQQGQQQQNERRHSLFGGSLTGLGNPLPVATASSAAAAMESPGSNELRVTIGGGTGTNFFVCKFCNSRAFSKVEEALSCEKACRAQLENKWRQSSGVHDGRLGSLDLLGALAGVKQEVETTNTLMNKSTKQTSKNDDSSPGPLTNAQVTGNFSVIEKPIPLGLKADKDWLTPLHCFVRLHCVEVFTATKVDVAIPTKGKRKPIQIGQVGIRCPHCHNSDTGLVSRERGSVYYPTSVSSIYNATMNLLQRHLHNCTSVKPEIMKRYETLKSDDARSGTSKKYWAESALSLGLVDTPEGIRFSSSKPPPLPSLTSEQKASDNYSASRGNDDSFFNSASNALTSLKGAKSDHPQDPDDSKNSLNIKQEKDSDEKTASASQDGEYPHSNVSLSTRDEEAMVDNIQDTEQSLASSAPLVTPDDEQVATQFSFYLLGQMQMCVFTEADRLGKRKGLPPGFPGLACRHCFGGYGSGRFFPSSIKTLSDTSKTLNVLFNHMMRCRKCPPEVRETLEKLRKVHDEQRAKMKFGSQKAFFARIWDRLHENDPHVDVRKRKFNQPKKPKPKPPAPNPVSSATAAENIMSMHVGSAHVPHSYLDATNAFTGSLGGLSTAGLLNGYGVGMLPGNNVFNPSSAQYATTDPEANKRLKLQNLARSNQN